MKRTRGGIFHAEFVSHTIAGFRYADSAISLNQRGNLSNTAEPRRLADGDSPNKALYTTENRPKSRSQIVPRLRLPSWSWHRLCATLAMPNSIVGVISNGATAMGLKQKASSLVMSRI
jgi:hypothetical protein